MEAKFGAIRQQMTDKLPVNVVVTTINDLKQDLVSVLPELKDGHQLTAENTHDSYQSDIDGYWQQQLKIIDDLLAQAITVYQQQQYIQASQLVQKAQYNGFKTMI